MNNEEPNTIDFSTLLAQKLEEWSDEQCLLEFAGFLKRVQIATRLVSDDTVDDDVYTHQVIYLSCGEKVVASEPQELEWPMTFVPGSTKRKELN